jgi:hypothetical protein
MGMVRHIFIAGMASGRIRDHISAYRIAIHDSRTQGTVLSRHSFVPVLAGAAPVTFADKISQGSTSLSGGRMERPRRTAVSFFSA